MGRWVRAAKAYEAAQGRDRLAALAELRRAIQLEERQVLEDLARWNSHAELAELLGVSRQAVNKRLRRPT